MQMSVRVKLATRTAVRWKDFQLHRAELNKKTRSNSRLLWFKSNNNSTPNC